MRKYTYVSGYIELKTEWAKGQKSPIIDLMNNAPQITSAEIPAIYSIRAIDDRPTAEDDGTFFVDFTIEIEGTLPDRDLETTCKEVETLIGYLKESSIVHGHGTIKVGDDDLHCGSPSQELSTIKIYDFNLNLLQ